MEWNVLTGGIVLVVSILYFVLWAETLREQAGKNKVAWFYMTLILSPLWIIYRIGEWL